MIYKLRPYSTCRKMYLLDKLHLSYVHGFFLLMRVRILLIAMLMTVCSTHAADNDSTKHWGFGLSFSPSKAIVMDEYQRKWQKKRNNFSVELAATRQWLPRDSSQIAADYNYPALSISLKQSWNHGVTMHRYPDHAWKFRNEANYDTKLGNSLSLYATFQRPIIRNWKWEFDYTLSIGAAYAHRIYNPQSDIDNELIGAHTSIYFGAGTHLTYHMTDLWGIRFGIDYWHMSNGAMDRPNKGANFIGPTLGVVYTPYHKELVENHRRNKLNPDTIKPQFQPYLFTNIAVAVGAKTLHEDWNHSYFGTTPDDPEYYRTKFTIHTTLAAQLDIMYRYARRWASGIGIDVFYGRYAKTIEKMDGENSPYKHHPWSTGIALKHEVYFEQLICQIGIGYYLNREMGYFADIVEKPYYERVGVSYAFKKLGGLRLGFNIKAHLTKADYTELLLTMPITVKKLKTKKH